jgi:hypothetical protein
MIAYDDLVAALTTWRARQGLSVAHGAAARPAIAPASPAPSTAPPRAPAGTAPASAPPRKAALPVTAPEEPDDYEGALIEETPYEADADDFVLPLGEVDSPGEPTAIGIPDGAISAKRSKRNDW